MGVSRDLGSFSLGHPNGILSLGRDFAIQFGMTTIAAVHDDWDVVLAADGLMQCGDERYAERVVKIMVLSDSLLVGFMSNSLESVRRIQDELVGGYVWEEPEEFCAKWNEGSRRVTYGYRNAEARITKALRAITHAKGYDEGKDGCGLLLAGKRDGHPVVSAWETSMGAEPQHSTKRIHVIGSKPEEGTVGSARFADLLIGDNTATGAEQRLVAAIRYCAVDLKLPRINGNVATCRMSERGRIKWHTN